MSSPIRWDRLPIAATLPAAHDWLESQAASRLSTATVDAYSRSVERYLKRCQELRINPRVITTSQVAQYFRELESAGLGSSALRQRYVAIRLFYAYVVERRDWPANPLKQSLAAIGTAPPKGRSASSQPWLLSESEWSSVLETAADEPLRTRLMLAVAYLGALRREELCRIEVSRGELKQGRLRLASTGPARIILITPPVAAGVQEYLGRRQSPALLFTSESRRNADEPITVWTWAKVTRRIAVASQVTGFSPAAVRHLRLTDLARAGHSTRDIAGAAGYHSPRLAYRYVELARRHVIAHVGPRREDQIEQLLVGRP